MNTLFKSRNLVIKTLSYFKSRKYCNLISTVTHDQLTSVVKSNARKEIAVVFSKESISPENVLSLLETVSKRMNLLCINLTKSLLDTIWFEVKDKGVPVDASHYNITMESYIMNDIDFDPLDILMEMKENNISYNNYTFELVLKKYCKNGDLTSATKLIEKMPQLYMYMNATKYGWLIGCAIRASKEEDIAKFYEEMNSKNLALSQAIYYFLAESYASKLDVDNCIEMYRKGDQVQEHLLIYKYNSFYELAKRNASDTDLLKLLEFINEKQDRRVFWQGVQKLTRSRLFKATNLLVANVNLNLQNEDLKKLAKKIIILQPTLDILEFWKSKIEDRHLKNFMIEFLSPYEIAEEIAFEVIQNKNHIRCRSVMNNLLINAKTSNNPTKNIKRALKFFQYNLKDFDFHHYLINFFLDKLLEGSTDQSYLKFITQYTDTERYLQKNVLICCIFHALLRRQISDAEILLKSDPHLTDITIRFRIRDFVHNLIKDRAVDDICERILFIDKFLSSFMFKLLVGYAIDESTTMLSDNDFLSFITFCKNDLANTFQEMDLQFIRNSQTISKERLEIIENFQKLRTEMAM